jgi:hypothetical protein
MLHVCIRMLRYTTWYVCSPKIMCHNVLIFLSDTDDNIALVLKNGYKRF